MLYIGKKWNSVNFRYGFAHYLKCSPVWETIFGPTIHKAYINIHLQLISVSHKAFWNFFSWVSSLSFICVTFQRHLQILCHASVECPLRFLCNCDGWPSVSPSSVTFRNYVTLQWSVPWDSCVIVMVGHLYHLAASPCHHSDVVSRFTGVSLEDLGYNGVQVGSRIVSHIGEHLTVARIPKIGPISHQSISAYIRHPRFSCAIL